MTDEEIWSTPLPKPIWDDEAEKTQVQGVIPSRSNSQLLNLLSEADKITIAAIVRSMTATVADLINTRYQDGFWTKTDRAKAVGVFIGQHFLGKSD